MTILNYLIARSTVILVEEDDALNYVTINYPERPNPNGDFKTSYKIDGKLIPTSELMANKRLAANLLKRAESLLAKVLESDPSKMNQYEVGKLEKEKTKLRNTISELRTFNKPEEIITYSISTVEAKDSFRPHFYKGNLTMPQSEPKMAGLTEFDLREHIPNYKKALQTSNVKFNFVIAPEIAEAFRDIFIKVLYETAVKEARSLLPTKHKLWSFGADSPIGVKKMEKVLTDNAADPARALRMAQNIANERLAFFDKHRRPETESFYDDFELYIELLDAIENAYQLARAPASNSGEASRVGAAVVKL